MCEKVIVEVNEDLKNVSNCFSIRLFFKSVFHCGVFVLCWVVAIKGCLIWLNLMDKELESPDLDNIKKFITLYLTNWNYTFQTIFLGLALTHDVLEWLDKHESKFGRRLRYWRDVIFTSLVVPFTLFVTGMFWSVYWIDRELVFPKVYDAVVPWWFNHCVHTNIAVVVIVETLLQPRRQPVNRTLEICLNTFVSVFYAVVYYSIHFFANRWLYAVFGVMAWWQICLFQVFIWASVFFFYCIQFPINRMIHGNEEETEETEIDKRNGVDGKTNGNLSASQEKNGMPKNMNVDLLTPPFSTRSWSLKYRSIREQFENSRL